MNKLVLVLSALAVGTVSATAADLAPRYAKAPAPVVAAFNWTGFYIGGFVGGAFADGNAFSTEPLNVGGFAWNGGVLPNSYSLSNSVIAGGTIGWNYQPVGTNWLIGIEGEAGYIRVARTIQDINAINAGFAYPDSLDATRIGDWYGVIAGRLGFAADRALFYAKGGVAFVEKNYGFADNCVVGGCGGGILNLGHSGTHVTWAAGAGVEYAFTNNWSLKGEYLYLATHQTYTVTGVHAAGDTYTNSHTDPGVHTAKVGINYRFGGPVVAKY
ncbi:MAG: porin family protein [Bradyrhizobium sp.]|uniref:outer membrane protein n=1 Tax=Bradyrhizobium sp. TaxID=376 RepID=UPI0025C2498D|nr:outer membrane beta-barrel protein [Bradyrhizobium sp.]MBI5265195.1 porin family protein [Bradyrhizobium sp.]